VAPVGRGGEHHQVACRPVGPLVAFFNEKRVAAARVLNISPTV
jgi:hypothetical protein